MQIKIFQYQADPLQKCRLTLLLYFLLIKAANPANNRVTQRLNAPKNTIANSILPFLVHVNRIEMHTHIQKNMKTIKRVSCESITYLNGYSGRSIRNQHAGFSPN